jgi:hypothetical protein
MAALVSCSATKESTEKLGSEELLAGTFPDGSVVNFSFYSNYNRTVMENLAFKWALLSLPPARGDFDVSSNICRIIVEKPGKGFDNFQIRLTYFPVSVKFGSLYRVSFDAMSDAGRFFCFKVGKEGGDWFDYSGLKEFRATTNWKRYSFTFKSMGNDEAARAEFGCALDTNALYFSNISLKPVLGTN